MTYYENAKSIYRAVFYLQDNAENEVDFITDRLLYILSHEEDKPNNVIGALYVHLLNDGRYVVKVYKEECPYTMRYTQRKRYKGLGDKMLKPFKCIVSDIDVLKDIAVAFYEDCKVEDDNFKLAVDGVVHKVPLEEWGNGLTYNVVKDYLD